jgi:hypothetical protein
LHGGRGLLDGRLRGVDESVFGGTRVFFLRFLQAEGWRTRVNTSSRWRFSVVGSICTLLTKSDSEVTETSFWTGTSAIAGWREALGGARRSSLLSGQ